MDDSIKTNQSSGEPLHQDFSSWIAEASHELRLPIANIKLLVETLSDGAIKDMEVAFHMLDRAHAEINRLERLVNDLLSLEQISILRGNPECSWVLLEEHAQYAIESTRTLAAPQNISVKLDIAPEFKVWSNPEQLDQILLNLIENAIKFTPNQGHVVIKSGNQSGWFGVIDTGIGIPEAEIPKIFQRFYRVDRAKSRGSTGLGLSIVKHIADLHGAKINVTSKVNEGTSFWLEFPSP